MELQLGNLLSRAKRSILSGSARRRISTAIETSATDDQGNFIGNLWTAAKKFVGFAISKLKEWFSERFQFKWSDLWGLLWNVGTYIWSFDWNQSDDEIDDSIEQSYNTLLTQAAGFAGQTIGLLVCGGIPGLTIFAFNEPMGALILDRIGEEAFDEIAGSLSALLQSTARTAARHFLLSTYKRVRNRVLDNAYYTRSNSEIGVEAQQKFDSGELKTREEYQKYIEKQTRIRDAAKEGFKREPYTFAKEFEKLEDKYIPEKWREQWNEFKEEAIEACQQIGYILTGGVDEHAANQKLTAAAIIGTPQTVVLQHNRSLGGSTP